MSSPQEKHGWLSRLWQRLRALFERPAAFPPPANPALLGEIIGWFAEQLANHPDIPMELRGTFARAARTVFERMTPTALLRWRRYTVAIRFFATLEELTVEVARVAPKAREILSQGGTVGGAFDGASGRLYLNGGDEETEDRDIISLYAHEFSHAINGPGRDISSLNEWREAWQAEIVFHRLSPRALVSPHEGFAEFGKFMYTGALSGKRLEKRYPRCVELWRGHGLW